jgi:predicted porin
MSQTTLRNLASLAGVLVLAMGAWAQETTPTEEPEEQEEVEIPVRYNSLTFGYSTWKASGNRFRMGQFARVPEGLTLAELKYMSPGGEGHPYYSLVWRGTPGQDSYGSGLVYLNSGLTAIRGSVQERQYYAEPSWVPTARSRDKVGTISVEHAIAPNIGAFVSYRSDDRSQSYVPPKATGRVRSRTVAGGLEGRFGPIQAGVNITDRRTFDDTGRQPATLQRRIEAHIAGTLGDRLSLQGAAGYTRIEQAGRPSGNVRTLAMAGYVDLGPATSLQFNAGRDEFDIRNMVQNAYTRKRFNSGLKLNHQLGSWNLQLGFRHREAERVRTDRTFVDVPKWNTYDARLSGRLNNGIRVTLRGNWEDMTASARIAGADPRQMLWDDKAMGQIKLDGGNELFTGYASYTYRFRQNKQRGVDVGWQNIALGGSYQFAPSLLGYAEWSYDAIRAKGASEGTSDTLDTFFPNSTAFSMGLDWVRNERETLSASLNTFGTNNWSGTQLTLQYRRQISADHSLDLVVAPWRFSDRLYGLTGYETTFLGVRYTVKF